MDNKDKSSKTISNNEKEVLTSDEGKRSIKTIIFVLFVIIGIIFFGVLYAKSNSEIDNLKNELKNLKQAIDELNLKENAFKLESHGLNSRTEL